MRRLVFAGLREFFRLCRRAAADRFEGLEFGGRQKSGKRFREVERDAAVAIADLFEADPDDFAGSHHRVEIAGAIVGDARGKNFAFQFGDEQRSALEIFHGVEKRVEAAAARRDALPARGEARKRALLDGFDFATQTREALAANLLQNFGVAPFPMLCRAGRNSPSSNFPFPCRAAENSIDLQRVARRSAWRLRAW